MNNGSIDLQSSTFLNLRLLFLENAVKDKTSFNKFHCMSVQYDKHIFIITNTMHTIGVDKITLFKTT